MDLAIVISADASEENIHERGIERWSKTLCLVESQALKGGRGFLLLS